MSFCQHLCQTLPQIPSMLVETWDNMAENAKDWMGHEWAEVLSSRALIQGLPIAVIITVAANCLFGPLAIIPSMAFATLHYTISTASAEILRQKYEIGLIGAAGVFIVATLVSQATIQVLFKTQLPYPQAFVLGIAAFSGQLARSYFITD